MPNSFMCAYDDNGSNAVKLLRRNFMPIFTNKATLSYNGITVDSNTVTGSYTELLTVSKIALPDSYGPESVITYVISLVNAGTTALTGLVVSDDLGGYAFDTTTVYPLTYVEGSLLYLINGTPQTAPAVVDGPPLVFSGINIPAGGNATIIYEAQTNSFAPLAVGETVTNTVTVTGGGLIENLTADETVTVRNAPYLSINKALSPLTVLDNGEIVYTFVISNSGNRATVATDDVVVTDLFDPILDISSVTLDGTPLSPTTQYTYNETTGLFETVSGVITVPEATYVQNPDGSYTVIPGTTTLAVTGII